MADDSFGKRMLRGVTLGASDLLETRNRIKSGASVASKLENLTGEPVSADFRKFLEKPGNAEEVGMQLEAANTKMAMKVKGTLSEKLAEVSPAVVSSAKETMGSSDFIKIQEGLAPGTSVKIGDFTITGDKIDVSQKKLINEISATKTTVDRVEKLTSMVPDLGGINFSSEKMIGKILGILPRGLEGRAREWTSNMLTAGEGGGLTGLTKGDEENLRTYISNLPTIGGETYKALSGDSGRLSDFDIERGKNLSWRPDLGETVGIRDKKNKILKESVVEREKAIRQGNFTIDPNTGSILTPQVMENALSKLVDSKDAGKQVTVMMEDSNGNRALVDKITGKVVKELPRSK